MTGNPISGTPEAPLGPNSEARGVQAAGAAVQAHGRIIFRQNNAVRLALVPYRWRNTSLPAEPAFRASGLRWWRRWAGGVQRQRANERGGRRVEITKLDLFPLRAGACLPRPSADVAELRGADAGHVIAATVQLDHLVACGTPRPSLFVREVEHLALAAVGPAYVRLANGAGGDTQPAAAARTGGADGAVVIDGMF